MAKRKKTSKTKEKPIPFVPVSGLADSGARTATVTGALRQPNGVEAGRYDLIPGECVGALPSRIDDDLTFGDAVADAYLSLACGDLDGVHMLAAFIIQRRMGGLHRLAVHYARGALKYADRNWEKGLETGRIVDSLFRHAQKALRGDTDEDHDAAAVWNCFALTFTCTRINDGTFPPELATYPGLCQKGE
jgi:hypothetical protein